MSGHTCHAHGCSTSVPPRLFMCKGHWYEVSERMRRAIWKHYRSGQENDKDPSLAYLAVSNQAIGEVAFRPHDEVAAAAAAPYLLRSILYRHQIISEGGTDPLPWIALPPLPLEGKT